MYTRSRGDIERFSGAQDLIPNAGVQKFGRHHVDAVALQEPRQFALNAHEAQAWHVAGLEFHQHVNIALWTEIVAKHRTEQREPPDVMPSAECRHGVTVDGEVWAHAHPLVFPQFAHL